MAEAAGIEQRVLQRFLGQRAEDRGQKAEGTRHTDGGQVGRTKEMQKMKKTCDEPGCDEKAEVRGKCKPHYNRWYAEERKKHGGLGLRERGVGRSRYGRIIKEEKEEKEEKPTRSQMKIDFSKAPELLDKLEKKAKEEFRSVNSQILYLIRRGLDG